MAVAIVMDFAGGTLAQYDQVIEKMGFTPGGEGAPEGQFHWVAATDDGIRVVDVWNSREAFDTFAQEQIGPITAEFGLAPPEMAFFDIHNTLRTG